MPQQAFYGPDSSPAAECAGLTGGEIETAELQELAVVAEPPQIAGFSQDRQSVDRSDTWNPPQQLTHMFEMRCRENGIEHRFTKINQPWINGQVERMNRAIKEATVKRYDYDSHQQLQRHLGDFVAAYKYST